MARVSKVSESYRNGSHMSPTPLVFLILVFLSANVNSSCNQSEKSFFDWCNDKNSTSDQKHTIEILLNEAGTRDCLKANTKLEHTKYLFLNGKNIIDPTPIFSLDKVEQLYLSHNLIEFIPSSIMNMKNLVLIDLSYNSISNIENLIHVKNNLQHLSIDNNKIIDISVLSTFENLYYLDITHNAIVDISALSNQTKLHTLYISHNKISDLSVLHNLFNLNLLCFNSNPITNREIFENTWCGFSDVHHRPYHELMEKVQ